MKSPFANKKDVEKYIIEYQRDQRDYNELEDELMQLGVRVKERSPEFIIKSELLNMAKWKWPAGIIHRYCNENTDEEIQDISAAAFSQTNEWIRITALTTLHGVGWPMASVILHFAQPDKRYPIIDVRALAALGWEDKKYDGKFWVSYTSYCRKLACEFEVSMRDLDRALWAKGLEQANKNPRTYKL